MRISSLLWLLALVVLGFGSTGVLAAGFTVDFETEPHPDLSEICNLYIGEAEYVYAFLVIIKGDGCGQETSAFGFDVGYKLICPDGSVVNRGFTRLPHWETLDPSATAFPSNAEGRGAETPAAVGYWTLELKKGLKSRAEFQLTPNPMKASRGALLIDCQGRVDSL